MKKLNLGNAATFVLLGSLLSTGILMGAENKKVSDRSVMTINENMTLAIDSVFIGLEEAATVNLLSLIKPMEHKDLRTAFTQEIRYPSLAVETNREGVVKVQFRVGTGGQVSEVSLVEKADDTLADEVIDAVKNLQFRPIIQNGIPVSYSLLLSVRFELL